MASVVAAACRAPAAERQARGAGPLADGFWHGALPANAERVCDGVYVVPRFLQDCLCVDPAPLFEKLLRTPVHPVDQPIAFEPKKPEMIPGARKNLKYRGQQLRRRKLWLQRNVEGGCLRYGYTGWQWMIAPATKDIGAVGPLSTIMDGINGGLGGSLHNHMILTIYQDGQDYIGQHSDKMGDLCPKAWILVVKLGYARPFEFYDNATGKVVWRKVLEAGTAVLMNARGNGSVKHGVPEAPGAGPSGSIVTRCVTTNVPWDLVHRKAAAAERASARAATKKAQKAAETAARTQAKQTDKNGADRQSAAAEQQGRAGSQAAPRPKRKRSDEAAPAPQAAAPSAERRRVSKTVASKLRREIETKTCRMTGRTWTETQLEQKRRRLLLAGLRVETRRTAARTLRAVRDAVERKGDEVKSHVSTEVRSLEAALGLNADATAEQLLEQAAALRERARQKRAAERTRVRAEERQKRAEEKRLLSAKAAAP